MSLIPSIFSSYNISLPPAEEALFARFLMLFQEYNAHTNLSAIRDEAGIIEKHFADSLILDRYASVYGRVLDIGSGGGFPGIPLAIAHPNAQFVTLDSVGKKVKAMNHFISELGLQNIRSIQGRAEEIARLPEYRGKFDFVLSRATAYLPQILEWSAPFLADTGMIVLYKLPSSEELSDGRKIMQRLGLYLERSEKYTLAGQERILLFFAKG